MSAVVHLAARKQVGEYLARPAWHYQVASVGRIGVDRGWVAAARQSAG